ncbi:MAG: hypothetical protein M5U09_20290 [Gammaproteobacteria bacterium]|nr:hypothetical protein [Gammaproteobacteria bacterium]
MPLVHRHLLVAARRGDPGCAGIARRPGSGPGERRRLRARRQLQLGARRLPPQRVVYRWLDELATAGKPLLAICGGHQMLAAHHGARVESVGDEPIAGTEAVQLTDAGRESGLFDRLGDDPSFHFANGEHVVDLPRGARLLATHPRLPCAALAYPGDWYSTQFHPEATAETLAPSWRSIRPELEHRYAPESAGYRLIENFVTPCRRR